MFRVLAQFFIVVFIGRFLVLRNSHGKQELCYVETYLTEQMEKLSFLVNWMINKCFSLSPPSSFSNRDVWLWLALEVLFSNKGMVKTLVVFLGFEYMRLTCLDEVLQIILFILSCFCGVRLIYYSQLLTEIWQNIRNMVVIPLCEWTNKHVICFSCVCDVWGITLEVTFFMSHT